MKDQAKTAVEKPLNEESINEKRLWVTPDIEFISSDDIMGGINDSFAETLFPAFFGTNS